MEEHVKGNGVPSLTMGDREQEEKILQPLAHTLQVPGKQILARIAHAYNYWLKVPADKLIVLKDIDHTFHYSLILIDDIQDNSILRRGMPVAHSIYGVASTLNAAIYFILKGLKRAQSLNHPDAITVCTEQLLDMYYGQGLEIYWRDNYTCPSLVEYKQMIQRKLASLLFRVRLMQLVSDNKTDYTKLNSILTMYYQVRDDYCNLCLQQYTNQKGYCDDISEGKFSFPIIHAITNHPDDQQVINILRQRTQKVELKKYCMTLLEKFGSLSFTRHTLEELDAEARAEVAKLGGNPVLENVLNEMLDWKKDRDDKNPEQ
uniref:Geranylgeranyl diphosphate synthase-4 n=2 Tax=Nasutitermes takasagoensis TaxID=62960 RepID=A0A4Y1S2P2_9NEOP|nr:geranylgeranyl diphosphate synthase-4 [Nasutitermes takasagoensis]